MIESLRTTRTPCFVPGSSLPDGHELPAFSVPVRPQRSLREEARQGCDSRNQVDTQKQPTVFLSGLKEIIRSLSLSQPPVPLPLSILTSSFAAKTK